MLSIYIGKDWDSIVAIDSYYNHVSYKEWYDDPVVRQIIKDIDGSDVVSTEMVMHPLLGGLPMEKISGGAKALILLYKGSEFPVDLMVCGDNCQEWIARISKMVDCRATASGTGHLDFKDMEFDFYCENNGERITETEKWWDALGIYAGNCERNVRDGKSYLNGESLC